GQKKIGESLDPPYNIVLDFDSAGVYEITARVIDNLYAFAYSVPVKFTVFPRRVNHDIAIYPNPNHGILTVELIESAGLSERYTISVVSYTGRVVYSETASVSEAIRTIDISDSPGGNYIVFISSEGKILSSKQLLKI
ncbi:T9SS type A sorting domain-containing protein, partial [bacterium]|nr:T9SS type A sorting domain-containing protein [bacterium]